MISFSTVRARLFAGAQGLVVPGHRHRGRNGLSKSNPGDARERSIHLSKKAMVTEAVLEFKDRQGLASRRPLDRRLGQVLRTWKSARRGQLRQGGQAMQARLESRE